MNLLSLLSVTDVQHNLALFVRAQRKRLKLSRQRLAERSNVPAATIKKFETTGQISLRQLLLIWQSIDQLERFNALCQTKSSPPTTIDEVLAQ